METSLATVLLVTGILTLLGAIGLLLPHLLLRGFFATATSDAATILLARHWSLLIGLVGGLLIYAAFYPQIRVPIMIVGAIEKLVLGALVLASPLRKRLQTVSIAGADAIMALTYIFFLVQNVPS